MKLCTYKTLWPLANPFSITGRVFNETESLVVEIGKDGEKGRGAGVGVFYLDDTVEKMIEQVEAVRPEIEAGISREALQELLPPGGARNALDCAFWDLETKLAGKTIWELTGITPKKISTVMTISIEETPEKMAQKAANARLFPTLKVKLDGKDPVERMTAIRNARPDAALVIDANQGFDFVQLKEVLPHFARLGVEMLEQPLPRGGDADLEGFSSPIPLCADESFLHMGDFTEVLPRYDMLNIKLDKTGGLTEALTIAREARAAGKRVMVGNMMGTSLSAAPEFVVAQLCDFIDLDGPLHLKGDFFDGMQFDGPTVLPPSGDFWGNMQTG